MDCNVKKEDLLTFFYGECEEGEQERMKEHVATCAVCRRELDALASTQALLRAWPDEAPRLDLTFVEAEVPRRRFRLMAGLAAAAVVALALFLAWPEFELQLPCRRTRPQVGGGAGGRTTDSGGSTGHTGGYPRVSEPASAGF